MRVKEFVAPTTMEAATQVREEFGPEAVILHTRRVRQPGLLGWFRPSWVAITAALEEGGVRCWERQAARPSGEAGQMSAQHRPASRAVPASAVSQAKLAQLAVAHLLERLRQEGVADEYLPELGVALRSRLSRGGEAPQYQLLHLLSESFPQATPWTIGRRPFIVPLVGPTGVGKTTTVAKLAASFALQGGCRVGLITADTFRVAAVEQLRTYAEILGLPLEVVYTAEEVGPALERLADRQLVLVDTAGRSPRRTDHMQELESLLGQIRDYRAYLVLSAATSFQELGQVIDSFSERISVDGVIVTKLDEVGGRGVLYNVAKRSGRPIAYLAAGQEVPDDLEAAEAAHMANLIVGVKQDELAAGGRAGAGASVAGLQGERG